MEFAIRGAVTALAGSFQIGSEWNICNGSNVINHGYAVTFKVNFFLSITAHK